MCKATKSEYLNLRMICFLYGEGIVSALISCRCISPRRQIWCSYKPIRIRTANNPRIQTQLNITTILVNVSAVFCEQPKISQHSPPYMLTFSHSPTLTWEEKTAKLMWRQTALHLAGRLCFGTGKAITASVSLHFFLSKPLIIRSLGPSVGLLGIIVHMYLFLRVASVVVW